MTTANTTNTNKAVATKATTDNKAVATKATIEKKAPAKRLRVNGKGKAVISRFVAETAVPVDAPAKLASIKGKLQKAGEKTPFGHNNNTLSIAREVDLALLNMIDGKGAIDSKKLIATCFAAYTTTSRVDNKPIAKQVDATFTKVASHLNGFVVGTSNHKRYLQKRMSKAGYSPATINEICEAMSAVIKPLRADMLAGKKAAKAYYAQK